MAVGKTLLVDNDENILNTYSCLLRKEGYYVVTAKTWIKALEEFCHNSFDLVIIDLSMNDGKGFTALGVIKTLFPDTSVIVFTNNKLGIAGKFSPFLGNCELIEKPCSYEILSSRVRYSLTRNKQ